MSRLILIAVGLTLLLCPAATVAAPADVEPYDAYLPNPEWTESDPVVPYHATRVIDAVTREPIEGARLSGYDEDLSARTIEYAALLREARSNADGIAWVPGFDDLRVDHWLVEAPGYAAAYTYAYQPPAVVQLVRGTTIDGRLADVHGRPLSGLELELFCGCIHGPVVARARTDEAGRVRFPAVDPETTRVWCVPERGAAMMTGATTLIWDAARGRPTRVRAGRTIVGRVVGPTGDGLSDVVVRAYGGSPPPVDEDPGFMRGPGTRTDAEGRFRLAGLPGVDEGTGLLLTLPGSSLPRHIPVPALPEPRLTIRITPDGDAVDLGGRRSPEVPKVAPLRLDGRTVDLLDEALVLSTDHQERYVEMAELLEGLVSVPTAGAVSLEVDGQVYRLEETRDGVRRVVVSVPPPHVVRFIAPFEIDAVALWRDGIEVAWPDVRDGRIETRCRGELLALVDAGSGPAWRVPLDLTGDPREHVVRVTEVGAVPPHGPIRLTWRRADGAVPDDVHLVSESLEVWGADEGVEDELEGPCHVRLSAPDLQPLHADLEPGEHELVWGAHAIVLEAFAPDGTRVQAVVMVDGELHRDFGAEPFRLGGIASGVHRVIVTPFDLRWIGVALRVDLESVETKLTVRFTSR